MHFAYQCDIPSWIGNIAGLYFVTVGSVCIPVATDACVKCQQDLGIRKTQPPCIDFFSSPSRPYQMNQKAINQYCSKATIRMVKTIRMYVKSTRLQLCQTVTLTATCLIFDMYISRWHDHHTHTQKDRICERDIASALARVKLQQC